MVYFPILNSNSGFPNIQVSQSLRFAQGFGPITSEEIAVHLKKSFGPL